MSRYRAHPNGYLTIDNDPTPVLTITERNPDHSPFSTEQTVILAELASDGNHAREWADRAEDLLADASLFYSSQPIRNLIQDMAAYHREGVTK